VAAVRVEQGVRIGPGRSTFGSHRPASACGAGARPAAEPMPEPLVLSADGTDPVSSAVFRTILGVAVAGSPASCPTRSLGTTFGPQTPNEAALGPWVPKTADEDAPEIKMLRRFIGYAVHALDEEGIPRPVGRVRS
jgi:hypothetical protein